MTQVQKAATIEMQLGGEEGGFQEVTCSFCNGHGKDPFGIMSWLSTCAVCGGGGLVMVPGARRRCAHCEGSGAIKTFTCTVCRGTGFVSEIRGLLQICPECRGMGSEGSCSALACLTCRGRGVVPRENPNPGK